MVVGIQLAGRGRDDDGAGLAVVGVVKGDREGTEDLTGVISVIHVADLQTVRTLSDNDRQGVEAAVIAHVTGIVVCLADGVVIGARGGVGQLFEAGEVFSAALAGEGRLAVGHLLAAQLLDDDLKGLFRCGTAIDDQILLGNGFAANVVRVKVDGVADDPEPAVVDLDGDIAVVRGGDGEVAHPGQAHRDTCRRWCPWLRPCWPSASGRR